ncbi:hypothetical protein FXO37_25392 [Capsicum annuum]|nr:hypothetical protein FXO37_25392 [Capsicum annuum]
MASSPSIFYRTSNDDIVDVDQCDAMIDDDDPWIRTTDCTCLGRLISDARSQIHLTIAQKIDEAHQLNKKRFDDCVEIKKLAITPARGYYMPSGLELSNRILREFGADSFIRVSFTDEGTTILNRRMLNFYTAPKRMKAQLQRTSIYRRIENILNNGFTLGTEHFKSETGWGIAKCLARMGLCFSSTYETIKVPSSQVSNLPEIIRNNYVFSDGIGKISASLAAKEAMLAAFDAKLAIDIRRSSAETINAIATMVAAGDIRILTAVHVERLSHRKDCLVFPQKGNRPHADETSGSDLDGDLYFVTWNENLIPVEAVEPMIYDSTKIDEFHGKVEDKDLIDFFLRYIIEDNLGSMSNAHLMQAHQSYFENLGPKIADLSDHDKQTLYEAKTSCWYRITYSAESKCELLEEDTRENAEFSLDRR